MANALDGRTDTQAGFDDGGTRTVIFDLGSSKSIDCVCVARHNFFTAGATLIFNGSNTSNSGPWTLLASVTFTDDNVMVERVTPTAYRYVQIIRTNGAVDIFASDVFIGSSIELPKEMQNGFIRPEDNDQDIIKTNITQNGALVGMEITTRPKKCRIQFNSADSSWFETNWLTLINGMKSYPVYFSWKSTKRSMYCWLNKKVGAPVYKYDQQKVSLDVEGIV